MKFKHGILLGVLLTVVVVSAFNVGQAYATTGCFTDSIGSWAESAICWMKDNGITSGVTPTTYSPEGLVTRSQMAVFLQKSVEIPPSKGDITINQGLSALQPGGNFASTAYVRYFADVTVLRSTSATTNYYLLSATIPTMLYGRTLTLRGVVVCYNATMGAGLTNVSLNHDNSLGATINSVTDLTLRTDNNCRSYMFTTPSLLNISDHIALSVAGNFASSASQLYLRSVDFVLGPTTNIPAGPIPAQEPLQDSGLLPDPATTSGADQ